MNKMNCDICILGAGTAGMAAAYALKDKGWKVALVENNYLLGGTAVNAWVETWIEGINPPYLVEIFNVLNKKGKAWGDLNKSWLPVKFAKDGKSSPLRFEPEALAEKYLADIKTDSNITVLTRYLLTDVIKNNDSRVVSGIKVTNIDKKDDVCQINAKYFIDSSGDGILCEKAGCKVYLGEDAYEDFQEDLMKGKRPQEIINEPSLLFMVKKVQAVPVPVKSEENQFCYDGYRDWFHSWINPMTGLGISGMDVVRSGTDKMYEKSQSLVGDFWDFIKQEYKRRKEAGLPLYGYTDDDLNYTPTGECAPMLGVRESYRVACEYMLKQSDLCIKIQSGNLKNFIACGSDEIDLHEKGSLNAKDIGEFNQNCLKPSGIPYNCLIPRTLDNVLVACRAYGASHIALAARRVNKDMAQLGWAAGHALRICCEKNLDNTRKVDIAVLQGPDYTGFSNSVKELEKRMK
jgi:hypothetical protein